MGLALAIAALSRPNDSRKLWLLRGSVLVLATIGAFAAVWLTPWSGIGMTRDDFNHETGLGLLLVGGVAVAAVTVVAVWSPLLLEEPKSELLRVLFGERLWVRGRRRFISRLQYQCERCRRDRGLTFSIVVAEVANLQRGTPGGDAVVTAAIAAVRDVIRAHDVLGDSGAAEIWILLVGAHSEGRERACERITDRLGERLAEVLGRGAARITVGGSTFGIDGRDPEVLLRAARERALGSDAGATMSRSA